MKTLLVCRSITYAKRVKHQLDTGSIGSRIVRTPTGAASEGCGYSVEIGCEDLNAALSTLAEAGIPPKKIISRNADGAYAEVRM